jgi:hypothetical protein
MAKRLEKSSQDSLDALKTDIRWCEERVRSLQALLPKEAARDRIKTQDIPALEKQLAENESKLDPASKRAETVDILPLGLFLSRINTPYHRPTKSSRP